MQINNQTKEKKIIIEAHLPVALEELALYALPKKEDPAKILELLNGSSPTPNYVMRKIARGILRKQNGGVRLKDIDHDYNDSENMTHGVAYFRVELEGTEKALRSIAGEKKLFVFDWQAYERSNTGEDP